MKISLLVSSLCRSNYTLVYGLILLTLGIALTYCKTQLLEVLRPSFILEPNSALEEYWRKPPMEIPTNVYLFNWTNPEDLHNTSIKLKFKEVGPYRYMHNAEKVNVTWNDNNTVTYRQIRTTAAKSTIMSSADPFVHTTTAVRQILEDPDNDLIRNMVDNFKSIVPDVPQFEKYGFLGCRNASPDFDGIINMANGIGTNFDIRNWNYNNRTRYFESQCANVQGSVGELYSPRKTRDDVEIFYTDVCGKLMFEYEDDVVVDGILGYKYFIGGKTLDNGTLIPENKCFCESGCIPSGVVNVSSCRYDFPIYGSLPHFYISDPVYLEPLEGLKPEKSKHETYVIIELETGVPLKAMLRVQLNILLEPNERSRKYVVKQPMTGFLNSFLNAI